jgi:hypothetical protein
VCSTHLPQLGITLFAHIKLLNARIQNIAKVSADWEAANGDPERAMVFPLLPRLLTVNCALTMTRHAAIAAA